jgi:hypothetical protein
LNVASEIASVAGIVVLCDATNFPDLNDIPDTGFAAALRQPAKRGDLFFIEADDPVRYRLRVLIDGCPEESLQKLYSDAGGSFKLELPSGQLVIAGLGSEAKDSNAQPPVSVPPETYLLTVLSMKTRDLQEYKKEMERLLGPRDTAYARAVDRVGLGGCLATLLLAVSLAIPLTRRYWWLTVPVVLLPWFLHFGLRMLPRYRRVEKVRRDFEKELPHFIVVLKRSAAARELPGGWIAGL